MNRAFRAGLLAGALVLVPATAASAADYEAHSAIVKYQPGLSATARAALDRNAGVVERLGTIQGVGATVVRVSGDPKVVAAKLDRSPGVVYAEPNYLLRATSVPNDPRFGELYGLNNANDADMDAPEGWDLFGVGTFPATGGVKVGIVDTGIDKTHEDLQNKVVDCADATGGTLGLVGSGVKEGTCLDDNDHGTHVAGTIAATANNGKGVTGVAFNSPLSICKALGGPLGQGSTAGVANCIGYLNAKGAKVISMSLGGGASTTLQQAVRNASGTSLLIAAAGNDGDATLNYPAAYAEVVSVAATDSSDRRASFSNANADVEVAAAGVNVLSTRRGGGYMTLSGTSMATPHVSGVAALIAGKGGTPSTWRTKLDSSVDDLGAAGRDPQFGYGRVNLVKAGS